MTARKPISLTPEQEALLPVWREKWRHHLLLNTQPADRETAEKACRAIYKYCNKKPPKFVWDDLQRSDLGKPDLDKHYSATEIHYFDTEIQRAMQKISVQIRYYNRIEEQLVQTHAWKGPFAIGRTPKYGQLSNYCCAAVIDFWRNVLGLRIETQFMLPVVQLCKSVGAVFFGFNDDKCYLYDRWASISLDDEDRPHSVDGPAIRFRDGREYFAYHGNFNRFFEKIFQNRFVLGIKDIIAADAVVRDFMVSVYKGGRNHGRFEHLYNDAVNWDPNGGYHGHRVFTEFLDRDECGELYRISIPSVGFVICLVKVKNAYAEPDGTVKEFWLRVPPRFRHARAAVAWTFHLPGKRYAPTVET